jgi:hypothetical protein
MTATSTANATSKKTVDSVEDAFWEKNSDTSTIDPNSATELAASTSWPNSVSVWPASRSTGTTRPSEVDTNAMATNNGASVSPNRSVPIPATSARANEAANATAIRPAPPRSFRGSISRPARNRRNPSPNRARTSVGTSTSTHSRPDGPTAMPSRISSTTAGRRRGGASRTSRGAARAITATTSRVLNESSGMGADRVSDPWRARR